MRPIALFVVVFLLSGVGASSPEEGGSDHAGSREDSARALAELATSVTEGGDSTDRVFRTFAALKQLEVLAKADQIGGAALQPIATNIKLPAMPLYGAPALRAIGAPRDADAVLFDLYGRQPDNLWLLLALAETGHPSEDVTRRLAALADETTEWGPRRAAIIALAARGDSTKDWPAQLLQYMAVPPGSTRTDDRDALIHLLALIAPGAKGIPGVEGEYWKDLTNSEGTHVMLDALKRFIVVAPRPLDASRMEKVDQMLRSVPLPYQDEDESRLCAALAPAILARDDDRRWDRAFGEIGRIERLNVTDWADLATVLSELDDPSISTRVGQALTASTPQVRLGAVRMAAGLGPESGSTLAALDKLLTDRNWRVRSEARGARVLVAGLDSSGQWVYRKDAEYINRPDVGWPW